MLRLNQFLRMCGPSMTVCSDHRRLTPTCTNYARRRTRIQPVEQWRVIASRYDKHAIRYRAGVVLAAIVMSWP
jgi:hypothetical protein